MQNNTKANRPTHRIYAVVKGKNDQSIWREIGAAWVNGDGKGFSLKLDYLPLNGAELVMREPKSDADTEAKSEA